MRTTRVVLAVVASAVAFGLAGCGGGGAGGAKVPTADGEHSTAAGKPGGQSGGSDVSAYVDSQRRWVACMRKNGIDLPDPDSKGQVDMSGLGLDMKKNPKFLNASTKCAKFSATVPQDLDTGPKLTAAQLKIQRDYAACMQKNGAPDFPDPGPDANRNDNSGDPGWDQSSAGAQRATRICAPIIGAPTNPPAGKG